MKTSILLFLLISVSSFAQINPAHKTLVCSGNNRFGDYSVIFKGPSWGNDESFGFNDSSLQIISKKIGSDSVSYQLRDLDGAPANLTIKNLTGKGTLTYYYPGVKIFLCKSSSSNSENLELLDFLKSNKMPYQVCPSGYVDPSECEVRNPNL